MWLANATTRRPDPRALDDGLEARGFRGLHRVTQLVHEIALAELDHPLLDHRQLDIQHRDDEIVQDVRDRALDRCVVGLRVDQRDLLGDRARDRHQIAVVLVWVAHRDTGPTGRGESRPSRSGSAIAALPAR